VYQAFLDELSARADGHEYKLTSTGCLGPCALGPNVFIYPEGTLYGGVSPPDVREIVEQHLLAGTPVARLIVEDVSS
jgi:(2Fe-2S) ferredoxin